MGVFLRLPFLALLVFSVPVVAQERVFQGQHSNIHYYGRWDFSKPDQASAGWGAVYVKLRFTGTQIHILLEDGMLTEGSSVGNCYQYSIDEAPFKVFQATNERRVALAIDLPNREHQVTFVRRTESKWGKTTLYGVVLDGNGDLLDPGPRPTRRVEVIGDSISVGLANENTGHYKNTAENGYLAWGPVLARALDAEWRVEGKGGGYLKNPGWNPKKYCMSLFFWRTFQMEEEPAWDFSSWWPDALILALGSNDFSEKVPDDPKFETDYIEFLKKLRSVYPRSHFFCLGAFKKDSPGDNCRSRIAKAVAAVNDPGVHLITGQENWLEDGVDFVKGDSRHPNLAGHAKLASRLKPVIAGVMGW